VTDHEFSLSADIPGERLDKFLSRSLADESRAHVQRLIEDGCVRMGDRVVVKSSLRLEAGDSVQVRIPPLPPVEIEAEAIPLSVLWENDDVLVIDKPSGLVVHPAAGHWNGTLVGAVLAHSPEVREAGEADRPGIVHRLDKDTSGLILVAKNAVTQRALQAAFAGREVEKTYLALVSGKPPTPEGRIEGPIGRDPSHRQRMAVVPMSRGREAVTMYQTREVFVGHTLLEAHPLTGRTHQIRVHLAFIGCPVAGDTVYGRRSGKELRGFPRQMLHAWRLRITLPGESAPRTFEAPIPVDMQTALTGLRAAGDDVVSERSGESAGAQQWRS
jgi:23S rRNA pseudouridine1911/1915/1917 synthase